jgi:hypothetical protein
MWTMGFIFLPWIAGLLFYPKFKEWSIEIWIIIDVYLYISTHQSPYDIDDVGGNFQYLFTKMRIIPWGRCHQLWCLRPSACEGMEPDNFFRLTYESRVIRPSYNVAGILLRPTVWDITDRGNVPMNMGNDPSNMGNVPANMGNVPMKWAKTPW